MNSDEQRTLFQRLSTLITEKQLLLELNDKLVKYGVCYSRYMQYQKSYKSTLYVVRLHAGEIIVYENVNQVGETTADAQYAARINTPKQTSILFWYDSAENTKSCQETPDTSLICDSEKIAKKVAQLVRKMHFSEDILSDDFTCEKRVHLFKKLITLLKKEVADD